MFTTTKLKRAWFSKDKEGGNVKPWAQGGKSMCHLPLSHPTTTLNVMLISWGSYCWQWSVAILSLLAHMHTPPGWPSCWQKNDYAHDPILSTNALSPSWPFYFLQIVGIPDHPTRGRGHSVHPLTRRKLGCSFSLTRAEKKGATIHRLGLVLPFLTELLVYGSVLSPAHA